MLQVVLAALGKLLVFESELAVRLGGRVEHFAALSDDVDPNAVPGDDGDPMRAHGA